MKALFFVPVWNQIDDFPLVLRELREHGIPEERILLVNNGSTDGSERLIRSSGYPYLDIEVNRGIGYSFARAAEWALERGYDVFGSLAGNGKMLPGEMGRILQPLADGEADYVTGSRFMPGGAYPNLPLFRRLSIPAVNLFVWALTGARLTDATCGYRAYRLEILRQAQFDWRSTSFDGYDFEYYVYAKVLLDGRFRWKEVPVTMRYPSAGRPYSKIKPFSGWYQMLRPWVKARFDGAAIGDTGRAPSGV